MFPIFIGTKNLFFISLVTTFSIVLLFKCSTYQGWVWNVILINYELDTTCKTSKYLLGEQGIKQHYPKYGGGGGEQIAEWSKASLLVQEVCGSNLRTIHFFFLSFRSDLVQYKFVCTWIPLVRSIYLPTMLMS